MTSLALINLKRNSDHSFCESYLVHTSLSIFLVFQLQFWQSTTSLALINLLISMMKILKRYQNYFHSITFTETLGSWLDHFGWAHAAGFHYTHMSTITLRFLLYVLFGKFSLIFQYTYWFYPKIYFYYMKNGIFWKNIWKNITIQL